MATVTMQLNTPVEVNRDMRVTMVHEATGQQFLATPFLDGTVKVNNVPSGAYRLKVNHANLTSAVFDNRVRVFDDRPTFIPIKIPPDLFKDTPIRETVEMDLGPVRSQLDTSAGTAERQTKKKGGQPIFADDWNELAGVVGDVARATKDLTQRVAPGGHKHPELVDKMQEIQDNLNRFLDVFGRSLAELQRQIQRLALDQHVNTALDAIGPVDVDTRRRFSQVIDSLDNVQSDTPFVYTSAARRAGEQLATLLDQTVNQVNPAARDKTEVTAAAKVVNALGALPAAHNYTAEVQNQAKVEAQGRSFSAVLKR